MAGAVRPVRPAGRQGGGVAGVGGGEPRPVAPPPARALRTQGAHLPALELLQQHALRQQAPPHHTRRSRLRTDRQGVGLGQLLDSADPDGGHGVLRVPVAAPPPALGRPRPRRRRAPPRRGHRAPLLRGAQGVPLGPPLRLLPLASPLHQGAPAIHSRVRDAAGADGARLADGGAAGGRVPGRARLRGHGLRLRAGVRLPPCHGPLQRRGVPRRSLPGAPGSQIPHLHPDVPHDPPRQEGGQLLPVHAAVRPAGWHARRPVLGDAQADQCRSGRGAGLRVPGARGGRDAVAARALRAADLRLHALLRADLPAAHVALRLPRHARHVGVLQDLRHLMLQPPGAAAPDVGGPKIRIPVLFAVCQGRHQQADRTCHSQSGQDGSQGPQPGSAQQERGSERRRHAVRQQAPGPPRARRPRQHPDSGGDPERDSQGHHRGVPHRRHVQAWQGHRALPLQEADPRHDDDAVDGAVPEDPAGGAAGVPAVPGAGDQVPVGAALQDVDRGQVAVAAGAAVGAARHALPPVRRAAHHRVPSGLHLRQARRHAPAQGRTGPRHLRVLARARGRARMPRRRCRALPRRVHAPRGRRHRRRPHRRRLGGGAQARAPASMIDRPGQTRGVSASGRSKMGQTQLCCVAFQSIGCAWFIKIQFALLFPFFFIHHIYV